MNERQITNNYKWTVGKLLNLVIFGPISKYETTKMSDDSVDSSKIFREMDKLSFDELMIFRHKELTADEEHYLYYRGLMNKIPGKSGQYHGSKETGGGYDDYVVPTFEWKSLDECKRDYKKIADHAETWASEENDNKIIFDLPKRFITEQTT
jgi:hypothetical protein